MEQKNEQMTDAYMGIKLKKEEAEILQKFEHDTRARARLVTKLMIGDLSDEKVAVALLRCSISIIVKARGDMLHSSAEDVDSFDELLSNIFKKANLYIKEGSELYCRIFTRCKELKMSDTVDELTQKDINEIAKEETEKYYAEKKDNDPEAD